MRTNPVSPQTIDFEPLGPAPERSSNAITPLAVLGIILLAYFLIRVQSVVVLVILALLFATIIDRPVSFLESRRIPRGLSILIVYILIFGGIGLAAFAIAPSIRDEADAFRRDAPQELRDLRDTWAASSYQFLQSAGVDGLNRAIEVIEDPPSVPEDTAVGVVSDVGSGLIEAVTVFVIAFYYLMEKSFLRELLLSKLPLTRQPRINRMLDKVSYQVGRWMRGQLTLCLIIGFASTVGYGLLDVPFWPLLGLFAGITEAIPIVGPFIGAVPAVVMAMTESWEKAAVVAIFATILQLTENWVLVPRVMRGAVGLTPLTVFVAILVGTEYMGIIGALLAIPIAAVVQVIISELLLSSRESQSTVRVPTWRWMRQQIDPDEYQPPIPNPNVDPASSGRYEPTWTAQQIANATSVDTNEVVDTTIGRGTGASD